MNISASGASTYTWTPNTTSQNAANSLVTITGAGAGKTTFTVTGTDGNGCIGSDTIDIYVRNIVAGAISTNQTICSGNLPNAISGIASTGGSGNFSYQWESSTDNVNFSNISGETAVNLSLSTPLSTTTFYRRKTNDQTAFAFSNVVTITVSRRVHHIECFGWIYIQLVYTIGRNCFHLGKFHGSAHHFDRLFCRGNIIARVCIQYLYHKCFRGSSTRGFGHFRLRANSSRSASEFECHRS
jgi:hypothetical protein